MKNRRDTIIDINFLLAKRETHLRSLEREDVTIESSGDIADTANGDVMKEIKLGLFEVERSELIAIQEARQRIRDGTYGICTVCDTLIPVMRLKYLPYEERCIGCQREVERGKIRDTLSNQWVDAPKSE